jgi:6-pyruvoyltetrahydropterin/6-carboxytetrahydropterin synthase
MRLSARDEMASYVLRVRSGFEAAHHLTSYGGVPEPSHGHSFRVEVAVETNELNEEGYGVDFLAIKSALDRLASHFHRRDINTVPPFDTKSPTAEHLAAWFFEELSREVAGAPAAARVAEVTVWEAPDCSATYRS